MYSSIVCSRSPNYGFLGDLGDMSVELLRDPAVVIDYHDQITTLADQLRDALAFLPSIAYREQIYKGQIWIAVDTASRTLCGYLMFGGTFPHLKVFHVAISPHSQGKQIGTQLIDSLVEFGTTHNYLTLSAKVAADLPANHFWEKMGFGVVRHLVGRGKRQRTINLRALELGTASLLPKQPMHLEYKNEPTLPNPLRVVDLNIFFDIVKQRVHQEDAKKLIGLALENRVRLAVTDEFLVELKRNAASFAHDPIYDLVTALPRIAKPKDDDLRPLTKTLREIIFPNRSPTGRKEPNNNSDLIHLATSILHRAQSFVTRETAILNASSEISDLFNIELLTATDLIESQIDLSQDNTQRSHQRYTDEVSILPITIDQQSDITQFLVAMQVSDEHSLKLGAQTNMSNALSLGAYQANRLLGYFFCKHSFDNKSCNAAMIVDERYSAAEKIVDHFLNLLETLQPRQTWTQLKLVLSGSQLNAFETAMTQGYRATSAKVETLIELQKDVYCGPVTNRNWSKFAAGYNATTALSLPQVFQPYEELKNSGLLIRSKTTNATSSIPIRKFESSASCLVIAENRDVVIIPIRKDYAHDLINYEEPQGTLLPSPEASLRLERAYFLSPGREKILVPGGLAFFYVSGANGGPMEVICMSRLTSSKRMTVEEATSTRRFGVVDSTQLQSIADKEGSVVMITFDQLTKFPNPISFKELKKQGIVNRANLVTTQSITTGQAETIIELGYEQ